MPENISSQFKNEGDSAFSVENEGKDNPTDSASEETNTNPTQSQEGDENSSEEKKQDSELTNFADHPRWKEREEDWKERFNEQEKRHLEEMQKFTENITEKIDGISTNQSNVDIPLWFAGDEQQYKEFLKDQDERLAQVQEKIKSELESKNKAEMEATQKATDYMNSEIESIQSDKSLNPDNVQIDKNKLLKFVLDNKIVDTEGRWNYRVGWQLMRANINSTKNEKLSEKKKIASASTSDNSAETHKPDYTTSEDFNNPAFRPW